MCTVTTSSQRSLLLLIKNVLPRNVNNRIVLFSDIDQLLDLIYYKPFTFPDDPMPRLLKHYQSRLRPFYALQLTECISAFADRRNLILATKNHDDLRFHIPPREVSLLRRQQRAKRKDQALTPLPQGHLARERGVDSVPAQHDGAQGVVELVGVRGRFRVLGKGVLHGVHGAYGDGVHTVRLRSQQEQSFPKLRRLRRGRETLLPAEAVADPVPGPEAQVLKEGASVVGKGGESGVRKVGLVSRFPCICRVVQDECVGVEKGCGKGVDQRYPGVGCGGHAIGKEDGLRGRRDGPVYLGPKCAA